MQRRCSCSCFGSCYSCGCLCPDTLVLRFVLRPATPPSSSLDCVVIQLLCRPRRGASVCTGVRVCELWNYTFFRYFVLMLSLCQDCSFSCSFAFVATILFEAATFCCSAAASFLYTIPVFYGRGCGAVELWNSGCGCTASSSSSTSSFMPESQWY